MLKHASFTESDNLCSCASFSSASSGEQSYALRSPSHSGEFELEQAKDAIMKERDAAIKARDAAIKARDVAIKEKDAAELVLIEESDAAIKARDTAVKERDAAVKERDAAVEERVAAHKSKDLAEHREQTAYDLLGKKQTATSAMKQTNLQLKSVTEQLRRQTQANLDLSLKLVNHVQQKYHTEQHVLSVKSLAETVEAFAAERKREQEGAKGVIKELQDKVDMPPPPAPGSAGDKIKELQERIKMLEEQLANAPPPAPNPAPSLSPAAAATEPEDLIFNKQRFQVAFERMDELMTCNPDEQQKVWEILKELGVIATDPANLTFNKKRFDDAFEKISELVSLSRDERLALVKILRELGVIPQAG